MKFLVVIPSRFGSTRFPGKPLHLIGGKPLLQRVIERVQKVTAVQLMVATDHVDIENLCEKLGVPSVKTDSELNSGTDRIFQALQRSTFEMEPQDVVLNVQGDEPLIPVNWIQDLAGLFQKDEKLEMATLAHPINWEEIENLNSVKVICDDRDRALYFSRFPIPHSRLRLSENPVCMKHIGVYAYRFSVLKKFCETKPHPLEVAESLEQLRALGLGIGIRVLKVHGNVQGVDAPEDVEKVEKILRSNGEL